MTDDNPESVEEAGALLGAAITKCNITSQPSVIPPKGMHSSFATMSPVPSSELFARLYQLRDLLRKNPRSEPLVAAPSLLAVLMKLLGVSSSLAPQFILDGRVNTPPLWSTPLRNLWVDSVVLCHVLGEQLSGKARIDIYSFVKNMVALAGLNPKSNKAAGGTRMAALQVVGGLFRELPTKLSPWALDVLHLCSKSLKSSGNGEPSYRIAACQTSVAVAAACRQARIEQQQRSSIDSSCFVLAGAMEDRALQESIKLLKQATTDKFPEVREGAAKFCASLAPLLVLPVRGDTVVPTASLEEAIQICFKNLDDESTTVALAWAEALARCLSTAIAHGQQQDDGASRRKDTGTGDGDDEPKEEAMRFSGRGNKTTSVVSTCKSLPATVQYVVENWFLKVGGELSASRLGGPFSIGGRGVRVGIGMVLVQLLRIQSAVPNMIGVEYTMKQILIDVLTMVGPELEKQLGKDMVDATTVTSPKTSSGNFFGAKAKSSADGGLARLAASRVLREGIAEIASEGSQLSMLNELISLCIGLSDQDTPTLNAQQLQVALVEISNLFSTLGEAAGSVLEELIPLLTNALNHYDHGVRHEAAMTCAALAASFPGEAREMLKRSIDQIQVQHAELVTQATIEGGANKTVTVEKKSRFRRKEEQAPETDSSFRFQYAIHGNALLIAVLLRELPYLPGGLPSDLLAMGMSVSEILVTCQYIDILTKANPNGACVCARAGYAIICGALTVGPEAIAPYIELIFGLWERAGITVKEGGKNMSSDHDLVCLDAILSSIVAFLEHCSELLLLIPASLGKTTIMLEKILSLFLPNGRLSTMPSHPAGASRHCSAKASLMEAFAWLPPGSFPTISNELFKFALQHVQSGTDAEVVCSLLPGLINNEDKVLDAKSVCRVQRFGQVGCRDIDNNCITLNSEATSSGERESVLQLQSSSFRHLPRAEDCELWGSRILGMFAYDGIDLSPPPTALHEVGTWRKPVPPSSSSKVRLVDAAIQAFSATFGLKDGKEQQSAMQILEQMVPPLLAQLARTMGVHASVTEIDRRSKAKDDVAAVANITAVLLACLKALPMHEATHDIPIGLGPPWMNKAKYLLLTLLPSASNTVRRAAAEGLALLATLGVTEDAHTLQSSVLHSLDEVMQGNKPDGKRVAIPMEPVSAARAGSLLTLGCIQRTAHNIKMIHRARSKGQSTASESVATAQRDALPTMQMMTRILPSIACHAVIRDAFVPRTYGLHAFNVLLSYSAYQKEEWTAEDQHLLKKAIESVEDNFLSCWTAVSTDMDGEQGPEKLGAEISFLAVILRIMTTLIPYLDESIAARFSRIAAMISEEMGTHPVILLEAMSFFEVLAKQEDPLRPASLATTVMHLFEQAKPTQPSVFASFTHCPPSLQCAEAGAVLLSTATQVVKGTQMNHSSLFALLNSVTGSRTCRSETFFRCLAAPREVDEQHVHHLDCEQSIVKAFAVMVNHVDECLPFMGNSNRWQVRTVATTFIREEIKVIKTLSPTKVSALLLAACSAVVATSESQELRPVQEAGADLLTVLIDAFGQIRDPSEPDSLLMEQYSSQILASVKHSVTLPGGNDDEGAYKLFMIGCGTLCSLIEKGVIADSNSFKRLVRPVIPISQEVTFVKLDAESDGSPFRGKPILSHVTKLSTVARITALIESNHLSSSVISFLPETIKKYKAELAVHCAAVALDSWRLRAGMKEPGFFYGNVNDLDFDTIALLKTAGPPCLSFAMICLSEITTDDNVADERQHDCKAWLDLLMSLGYAAFHGNVDSNSATFYLQGLRCATQGGEFKTEELAQTLSTVCSSIIHPYLGFDKLQGSLIPRPSDALLAEACKFIEVMAGSTAITDDAASNLLVGLLLPLDALQRDVLDLNGPLVVKIIVSHIKAMQSIIEKGLSKPSLIDAMLQFSTTLLSRDHMKESLSAAAESLMELCLTDTSITKARQESIAQEMADHGKWKSWSIVGAKCPAALTKSLKVASEALEDVQNSSRHMDALDGVRNFIQGVDSTSPVVGVVFKGVGASCLGLFRGYAKRTLPLKDIDTNRMAVCGDVMKIIMIAYQHAMTSEHLVSFLSVVFNLWTEVIQYNGLPNQPSPHPGANPVLGRLSAQAIVHVARTSPAGFKETVAGGISPHGRAILEFAVRADMSGYASSSSTSNATNAAPEKKKLNLKSFKK